MSATATPAPTTIIETRDRVLHISSSRDEVVVVLHGAVLVLDGATLRRAVMDLERESAGLREEGELRAAPPSVPTVADLSAHAMGDE